MRTRPRMRLGRGGATALSSVAVLAAGVGLASMPGASARATEHPFPPPARLDGIPSGSALADASEDACRALLRRHDVTFRGYEGDDADDLRAHGISLTGPIRGIRFEYAGRGDRHAAMDCRLALALLAWTPILEHYGVSRIVHLSTFRPNARVAGSGRRSGHADGLALDLRFVEFVDGTRLDVLEDWTARTRGADPCVHPAGEDGPTAVLRRITCEAVERDLFQVVITPHHDEAHANHVHLEVRPATSWRYTR